MWGKSLRYNHEPERPFAARDTCCDEYDTQCVYDFVANKRLNELLVNIQVNNWWKGRAWGMIAQRWSIAIALSW